MFAVRKSDKQVRDKEGIPRISGQDSEVTGEDVPRGAFRVGAQPMRRLSSGAGRSPLGYPFTQRKEQRQIYTTKSLILAQDER